MSSIGHHPHLPLLLAAVVVVAAINPIIGDGEKEVIWYGGGVVDKEMK